MKLTTIFSASAAGAARGALEAADELVRIAVEVQWPPPPVPPEVWAERARMLEAGPAFYLHRLDICRCGLRRGDHDGTTGCAFVLARAHDPRARSLEVTLPIEPVDGA